MGRTQRQVPQDMPGAHIHTAPGLDTVSLSSLIGLEHQGEKALIISLLHRGQCITLSIHQAHRRTLNGGIGHQAGHFNPGRSIIGRRGATSKTTR
ncbi:hypothetical protein [Ectothiorhodospira sp. BSL-9]|uniref:hypothetical protein n=1 Tax=Ectothiorhodospira sp. BSL-9 TaxID=1442136 RepID=UPI00143BDFB9|nr:hypothetical protein [Ectothiorhodospira sp. BSL-9]